MIALRPPGSFVRTALALAVAALLPSCRPGPLPALRLATTTSVDNSGLLDHLRGACERETGVSLEPFVVGSGRAARMAISGEVSVAITHDVEAEEVLLRSGKVALQQTFMTNRFLLVGPAGDPAGVARAHDAVEAFRAIGRNAASFASRDDQSGTHSRERQLFREAGFDPDSVPGRIALGQSMGALLRSASEMKAYTLTDEATWAALRQRLDLVEFLIEDRRLQNRYVLTVMEEEGGEPRREATRFARWLLSDEGAEAIRAFRIGGRPVFVPLKGASPRDVVP